MTKMRKGDTTAVMVTFSESEEKTLLAGMARHSFNQRAAYLKWVWAQHEKFYFMNQVGKEPMQ
jgi:hypothetical protein